MIHSRRVLVSNQLFQLEPSFGCAPERRYKNKLNCVGAKKQQLPPLETKPSSEDILNAILPPREWVENGKHYI